MSEQSKVSKMLDARNDVDYRAYQLLINDIFEVIKYDPFKSMFIDIFKEWHSGEWDEAGEEIIKNIEQIFKDRIRANEDIMDAVKEAVRDSRKEKETA